MIQQAPISVLGFYGATMDAGSGPRRWERWRPTVSLFQREDLVIDRLDLIVPATHRSAAGTVIDDVRALSPETTVVAHALAFDDPWDLGEVYEKLFAWVRDYPFVPEERQYWVHLTTGTHIAQICWSVPPGADLTRKPRSTRHITRRAPHTRSANLRRRTPVSARRVGWVWGEAIAPL